MMLDILAYIILSVFGIVILYYCLELIMFLVSAALIGSTLIWAFHQVFAY